METKKTMTRSAILTALALLLGGCGSNDGFNQTPGYNLVLTGFGVLASDPPFRATFVPVDSDISVKFNEPINQSSLAGNYKFTKMVGNAYEDYSGKIVLNLTDSNSTIIASPTQPLSLNANYKLTFLSGLTSVSGRPLQRVTDVIFSTGSGVGAGFGGNNDPDNKPSVRSVEINQDATFGVSFIVTFSEDLAAAPTSSAKVTGGAGLEFPLFNSILIASPVYSYGNQSDTFYLDFPGRAGCDPNLFSLDTRVTVEISGAIDNDGQRMPQVSGGHRFDAVQYAILSSGCH